LKSYYKKLEGEVLKIKEKREKNENKMKIPLAPIWRFVGHTSYLVMEAPPR
jgi:hypothetical protein